MVQRNQGEKLVFAAMGAVRSDLEDGVMVRWDPLFASADAVHMYVCMYVCTYSVPDLTSILLF
jgi:hypothetical protein